jgi:hypothetical protein
MTGPYIKRDVLISALTLAAAEYARTASEIRTLWSVDHAMADAQDKQEVEANALASFLEHAHTIVLVD